LSKPKLIIFDLDGTLVPTMQGFADIAAQVISDRYSWDRAVARQAYLDTSGIPFHKQLEVLFPSDDRNAESAERFEMEKKKHFFSQNISDGVKGALHLLKTNGHYLAVSSNNFELLVQRFVHDHAPGLFDRVLGFKEQFEKGKDHFDHLGVDLKADRSEMLFIGDSLSDLRMAQQERVSFVGVAGTFRQEDFSAIDPNTVVLEDLTQLPTHLKENEWTSSYLRRA
jgi:phosphoglycolate phosphatase-like HAD superfamily hydrolase